MFGPDISNNQGSVNYPVFFAAKPDLVYAKVSEGTWFTDRYFRAHHDACTQRGVPVGGYHFSRGDTGTDPVKEADFFCDRLAQPRALDLRPALDMEVGPASRKFALAFCAQVEKRTGVKPVLYTYPDFYRRLGGWPAEDTWIANLVSPGKSSIPNVLQQYTWNHVTPGVSGQTDYNYCAGLTPLLARKPHVLTPVEERFLFFRWWLGEGEFVAYGPHSREHRPVALRARIPKTWWVLLVAFIAARSKNHPNGADKRDGRHQSTHSHLRAQA